MSTLTPQNLKELIQSDALATQYLNDANDVACRNRCVEIAPLVAKPLKLSFVGVLSLYKDSPIEGSYINKQLREVAKTNEMIADVVAFMSSSTPVESYPDFSLAPIREALTTPVNEGGCGFTTQQVSRILESGVQNQDISLLEIEYVRTRLWP